MPAEKAAESWFWDRYIEILKQAKVPEPAHRWYVVRVERYIAAHSILRLRLHTPTTVDAYLSAAGDDLRACAQQRWARGGQPAGCLMRKLFANYAGG